MEIAELKDKMVAVAGFGLEGEATARYLLKHGIKPVLFDERPWEGWEKESRERINSLGANFIFGPDAFLELKGFDVVFRSPGVRLSRVKESVSDHAFVTSQTKYFFDHCPAKIIGITGTKGKGTTASLIYEMLVKQRHGSKVKGQVFLTGNIGKIQPFEIIESLKPADWVVYELSSFQLQDLQKSPHISVVLMTTSEHLDYHQNQAEYWDAKASIVKYQKEDDYAVVNADYEGSLYIGKQGKGRKNWVSGKHEIEGVGVKGGEMVGKVNGVDFKFQISNFKLRGGHNLENIGAAVAAGIIAGCGKEVVESVLNEFKGLEHRLELVAEKNGVKYYNDSFSTTPETAIAAINSFSEPLIVILGGSGKNSDFTALGETISKAKNIKAVILVGQERERILQSIKKTKAKVFEGAQSMEEILSQARSVSKKGDVVLLSPACASFGMFKNYKDRGEQFKKITLSI